jgi:hypothetical protein
MVVESTNIKTHLQMGLGMLSGETVHMIADVLYGFEYLLNRNLGVSIDLQSYVGITAGAGLSLMTRYHF